MPHLPTVVRIVARFPSLWLALLCAIEPGATLWIVVFTALLIDLPVHTSYVGYSLYFTESQNVRVRRTGWTTSLYAVFIFVAWATAMYAHWLRLTEEQFTVVDAFMWMLVTQFIANMVLIVPLVLWNVHRHEEADDDEESQVEDDKMTQYEHFAALRRMANKAYHTLSFHGEYLRDMSIYIKPPSYVDVDLNGIKG